MYPTELSRLVKRVSRCRRLKSRLCTFSVPLMLFELFELFEPRFSSVPMPAASETVVRRQSWLIAAVKRFTREVWLLMSNGFARVGVRADGERSAARIERGARTLIDKCACLRIYADKSNIPGETFLRG